MVSRLRSRTSICEGVMHLLHCLLFIEVGQQCYLHPAYIDTRSNYLANALQHESLPLFLFKYMYLGVDPYPTPISLIIESVDTISRDGPDTPKILYIYMYTSM